MHQYSVRVKNSSDFLEDSVSISGSVTKSKIHYYVERPIGERRPVGIGVDQAHSDLLLSKQGRRFIKRTLGDVDPYQCLGFATSHQGGQRNSTPASQQQNSFANRQRKQPGHGWDLQETMKPVPPSQIHC
jgi:hypothetical protein